LILKIRWSLWGDQSHTAFDARDVSAVVAAACLAHDIGNAPLGHGGEEAIATFFSEDESSFTAALSEHQRQDLQRFEGNAQGLRILTRLQNESAGGLMLTAATLGAFTKYPQSSTKAVRACDGQWKKHGFLETELSTFRRIALATGLRELQPNVYSRHPLAFLVEAADDICYSILDIEDGVRLSLVQRNEACELLASAAGGTDTWKKKTEDEQVPYLRAVAVGSLVREAARSFLDNEGAILAGDFRCGLLEEQPQLRALRKLAKANCYRAAQVLELEIAGSTAIKALLKHFVDAVVVANDNAGDSRALRLLKARHVVLEPAANQYERILRITDYVSGMTDRYVLDTYRRLAGIDLRALAA